MCGVIASTSTENLPVELLEHRGIRYKFTPAGGGAVVHVRLPIVGLGEQYDQPVQEGPWTIAFVGEILDFRDEDPGAECDLGIVVDAWVNRGPHGLRGRDGFWSVVAVNSRDKSLHLLCDYLAQKPLYYRTDMRMAASEPAALAAAAPVTPDEVYLAAVIKWGYCPQTDRTPYREVKKVRPGEHVVIHVNRRVEKEVVDRLTPRGGDLKHEITEAVRRRVLASDVPVACLVSGGLDSSIVYTLADRYGDVRAYYASDHGEPDTMERLAVSAVIGKRLLTEIDWRDVPLDKALEYMQEPIDLGSLVPQVALSDQIKESVCLTGDGADELFGGYGRAQRYDSQASDVWHELVAWHLPRLDRVMMRNRVEVRSPFLARRVAEVALSLPWPTRRGKKILRDLFRDDLPIHVADRPKVPLRTKVVERDREAWSSELVRIFREKVWEPKLRAVV
jgi:asparagine synthase (glutamine-hydrolysing)